MDGTLIGETMKIKGEITSRETLQLNGELEGSVELDNRLTVGPKGKASANIKAKDLKPVANAPLRRLALQPPGMAAGRPRVLELVNRSPNLMAPPSD